MIVAILSTVAGLTTTAGAISGRGPALAAELAAGVGHETSSRGFGTAAS